MADRMTHFSGPMIRALLDGRKTQTRRVLNPQPRVLKNGRWYRPFPTTDPLNWQYALGDRIQGYLKSPCAPGDRLWAREAHAIYDAHGQHRDDRVRWGPWGDLPTTLSPDLSQIAYFREGFDRSHSGCWRPSIHMPRWASRLTLVVTEVRVERLQDISERDAEAEGCRAAFSYPGWDGVSSVPSFRWGYHELWDSLNAARGFGWEVNPWVVAITFTVHKANIDAMPVAEAA